MFLFLKLFFKAHDSNEEPGVDFKTVGYYLMISVPIAFTIFGLSYMIQTNSQIRQKCCKCCVNFETEKEDKNLDYGTYYYDDGERRQDVMEVTFRFPSSIIIGRVLFRK